MKALLPWMTSAGTLIGMWAVGRKKWWGWLIGILNQVTWISMSIAFHTWGLIPLSAVLVCLYSWNLYLWRKYG